MKKITKFTGFNKHLRIFILISMSLFMLAGIAHIKLLLGGDIVSVGDIVLPKTASYLAIFGAAWMTVMGIYYYLALAPEKDK